MTIILLPNSIYGQFTLDSEFAWEKSVGCVPKSSDCEVFFLKADDDAYFTGLTNVDFRCFLDSLAKTASFLSTDNGLLKVKIGFYYPHKVCVLGIGQKGILLSKDQLSLIRNIIQSLPIINYAKYKNHEVQSQGILYLSIKNGLFDQEVHHNFLLADEF
ncbi:MAG: hypothetical protein WBP08_04330 [Saprospiraceae bacterium]